MDDWTAVVWTVLTVLGWVALFWLGWAAGRAAGNRRRGELG